MASQLRCDMTAGCEQPITHIDNKGFIYCTKHGIDRRGSMPCRKLRPYELRRLLRGETIRHY